MQAQMAGEKQRLRRRMDPDLVVEGEAAGEERPEDVPEEQEYISRKEEEDGTATRVQMQMQHQMP